jgi:protein-disulfide isomerase
VERDDVRRELESVRRRRQAAIQQEAELAREEAVLEATLGRELDGDTPADQVAVRESTRARLDRTYGTLRSPADLTDVLHAWRRRIPGVTSLWAPVEAGRDHLRGDPAAPVVVVEYGDYQCPECAEAHGLAARVAPWVDAGRLCFAFRHFPVVDAHPFALRLAQAAEAAAAQGQFWQMHDLLMQYNVVTDDEHQEHVALKSPSNVVQLEHVARQAGLDLARFRSDADDAAALERILDDFRGGLASGVNGTPSFYLNGRRADVTGPEDVYAQVAALVGG